jgi:RNA polymerase-interacting CarD/CdnL/TRCF family regulator
MVQVGDLTIWVPADNNLKNRLRFPTSEAGFRKLLSIFSSPAEPLPDDRRERNIQLQDKLKNGGVESLCIIIRDLTAYRRHRSWNDYDSALMKRVTKMLIGEWSVSLNVAPKDAEMELHSLLASKEN